MSQAEKLRSLRMFAGLPSTELDLLERSGAWVHFPTDTIIFRQGEPARVAYLVVDGRMKASVMSDGGPRDVGDIWAGDVIGEAALFQESGRRSAQVVALGDCFAIELSPALLETLVNTDLRMAIQLHLMGVMARRLRGTDLAIRKAWQEQRQAEAAMKKAAEAPSRPDARGSTEAEPTTLFSRIARLFGGT